MTVSSGSMNNDYRLYRHINIIYIPASIEVLCIVSSSMTIEDFSINSCIIVSCTYSLCNITRSRRDRNVE